MAHSLCTVVINYEDDVVTARQRARQVAQLLGFEGQDQTRISTAVSEVARIFVNRKTTSHVEFFLEGGTTPQILLVRIGRPRPSVPPSMGPLHARSVSPQWETAMLSARRLMDQCEIRLDFPPDPTIWLKKILIRRTELFTLPDLDRLTEHIGRLEPKNPIEEIRCQNQELLHTLEELHERQQELLRLNGELEDTNRGVVALYAELDEKADHLRRADEMKSRFLSNMSHEFRTPLNAILALAQLLLEGSDGVLTSEQEKQVGYIKTSGEDLLELVNDLLDIAKIEAGKIAIRPSQFEISNLFSALRGMLRPLLVASSVNLVFEDTTGLPILNTDEGKVSQIIRNFISNAIKFTESGEVRVAAKMVEGGSSVGFFVTDTGIGIAESDQEFIFQEFSQIDHPIQRRVKGTGLGLPLCRKLAELLGGSVNVMSRLGVGSTFSTTIPVTYIANNDVPGDSQELISVPSEEGRMPILLVEDEPETRLLYEKYFRYTAFQAIPAGSIRQGREALRRNPQIAAIVLDILLPDEMAWHWLAELKGRPATKHIPVFIISSIDDAQKGLALGADDYCIKPVHRSWLLERLERAIGSVRGTDKVAAPVLLIIDDQETDRYLLRKLASETGFTVVETTGGEEGISAARKIVPSLILLDLNMPEMSGFEVLERLQDNLTTKTVPVIVVTSQILTEEHIGALHHARAIIRKSNLSPQGWRQALEEAKCDLVNLNETVDSKGGKVNP